MKSWLAFALWSGLLAASEPMLEDGPTPAPMPAPAPMGKTMPPANGEALSDAERVARLHRALASDMRLLAMLTAQLDNPDGDYAMAEAEFNRVEAEQAATKKELAQRSEGGESDDVIRLEKKLRKLEGDWRRARDRFNLAIEERKVLQQSVAALQEKIRQSQQTLDRLTTADGMGRESKEGERKAEPTAPTPPREPAKSEESPASPSPTDEKNPEPAKPPAAANSAATDTATRENGNRPPSRELLAAKQVAKAKEAAAKEARSKAESVTERLTVLQRNIELKQKLLDTARAKVEQALRELRALKREQTRLLAEDPAGLDAIFPRMRQVQERVDAARDEAQSISDHLTELWTERNELQSEQIAALQEAEARQKDAESALLRVAQVSNPFSPANLVRWSVSHGPKIVLILIGMWALRSIVRSFSHRIVSLIVSGSDRGTEAERENRAQTLVGVFRNTAALAVLCGGTVMLLDVVGIPIVPLMGGAAVVGLAVAFGAQNLIRDYFSGFMVLLEDQYGINDVVRINNTAGLVEQISLRVTVLRDIEGVVHFIPHGTITTVSNMTHSWSRALFDIRVAYKEDVDRVMQVLVDLGRELRQDPKFGRLILADPEMLGVDNLADSGVVIRFFIKTRPLQQWAVRRELLRRIKRRFDQLGIEIPFPHQTVYHRNLRRDEMGMADDLGDDPRRDVA